MVDAADLGSAAARRESSSLLEGTIYKWQGVGVQVPLPAPYISVLSVTDMTAT